MLSVPCEDGQADVAFVMDVSGSMHGKHLARIMNFMSNFTSRVEVGPDDVQIGLVQFRKNPLLLFNLVEYDNKQDILQKLSVVPEAEGDTQTHKAIHMARTEVLTEEAGSRATLGVPQTIIVITDGKSKNPEALM